MTASPWASSPTVAESGSFPAARTDTTTSRSAVIPWILLFCPQIGSAPTPRGCIVCAAARTVSEAFAHVQSLD